MSSQWRETILVSLTGELKKFIVIIEIKALGNQVLATRTNPRLFSRYHLSRDVLTREEELDSKPNIGYVKADLTDYTNLKCALNQDYHVGVHCSSNPKESDLVDVKGTQNLLDAIEGKNVKNFIYTSIVGVDKTTYRYYQNKLRAEELIFDSSVPYTILRLTQFHDFVLNRILVDGNENKVSMIPAGLRFQSIDLRDVCKTGFKKA